MSTSLFRSARSPQPLTPEQQALVTAALPLADQTARRFRSKYRSIPSEDLRAEAHRLLVERIPRFDPALGTLALFVRYQVHFGLMDFVRKARLVNQRERAFSSLGPHEPGIRWDRETDSPVDVADIASEAALLNRLQQRDALLVLHSIHAGARLPHQEIFERFYGECDSSADIAVELGVTVRTVERSLRCSRETLRKRLSTEKAA